jgi:hypothetical protein
MTIKWFGKLFDFTNIYGSIETTMVWRAVSRIGFNLQEENIFGQWLVAVGASISFFSFTYQEIGYNKRKKIV